MKKGKIKTKINSSKIAVILSLLLMIVIILYTCLNSSLFNSKNIVIEGNKYIDEKHIIELLEIKNDKNIFRYNIKSMEDEILNNKYIESVNIKRLFPNTIKISIIEKEILAILNNNNMYCYIDNEGNFIDEINIDTKDSSIVMVNIDYDLDESYEIKFKNKEKKKLLLDLFEFIEEESIYNKIKTVDMIKDDVINMYTKDNIKILINSDELLEYNISKLSMILSDLQSKNQEGGEIDLSIGKYALYRN